MIIDGASNMAEGIQHINHGNAGDPFSAAWNPLRDGVFGGTLNLLGLDEQHKYTAHNIFRWTYTGMSIVGGFGTGVKSVMAGGASFWSACGMIARQASIRLICFGAASWGAEQIALLAGAGEHTARGVRNLTFSVAVAGSFGYGRLKPASQGQNVLNASNKSSALQNLNNLPSSIQPKVKSFFKRASSRYTDFSVTRLSNGNFAMQMTKPGNVPGSFAVYHKVITPKGNVVSIFKDTFGPSGNFIHRKYKLYVPEILPISPMMPSITPED